MKKMTDAEGQREKMTACTSVGSPVGQYIYRCSLEDNMPFKTQIYTALEISIQMKNHL